MTLEHNGMKPSLGLSAIILMAFLGGVYVLTADASDDGESVGYVLTKEGLRLRYRVVGEGAVTVLVPGAVWLSPELDMLAHGRRIVYYDQRARGGSERVSDSAQLGFEREVEDMETLRASLGLGRVSLVGWSYLGATVALYASRHPDNVERVVQIGPMQPARSAQYSYELLPSQRPSAAGLAEIEAQRKQGLDLTDPAGFCRLELRVIVLPGIVGDPASVGRLRADPCRFDNEWPWNLDRTFGHLFGSIPDWNFRAAARRVKAPTLIIHGDRDRTPIEGGEEWARLIPDARLLAIGGAGHAAWLDAPDRVFAAIDRFLSGSWPEDARRLNQ